MHLVSSLSGGCLPERWSSFALGVWAGWECLVPILDDSLQVVFHFYVCLSINGVPLTLLMCDSLTTCETEPSFLLMRGHE